MNRKVRKSQARQPSRPRAISALVRVPNQEAAVRELEKNSSALALVSSGVAVKRAVFFCPCGCGEKISLNLLTQARPSWRVRVEGQGTVSIWPSIWRLSGCRSHFWIRSNQVTMLPRLGGRQRPWSLVE